MVMLVCLNCGKTKREPQPEIVRWLCCDAYMCYKE